MDDAEFIGECKRTDVETAGGISFTTDEWKTLRYGIRRMFHGSFSAEPLSAAEAQKLVKVVEAGEKFLRLAQSVDDGLLDKMKSHLRVPRLDSRSETVSGWCSAAKATLGNHKRQKSGERYTVRQIEGFQTIRAIYSLAAARATSPSPSDYPSFLRIVIALLPQHQRWTLVEKESRQIESVIDYATKKVPIVRLRASHFQCAELNEHLRPLRSEGRIAELLQSSPGSWVASFEGSCRTSKFVTLYTSPMEILYWFQRSIEGRSGSDTILSRLPSIPPSLHNEGWTGGSAWEAEHALWKIEDNLGPEVAASATSHLSEHDHFLLTLEEKQLAFARYHGDVRLT